MPRTALVALALSALAALTACATTRTEPIVVGPTTVRDAEALLSVALDATTRAGYAPDGIDPVRGGYRVRAHGRGARGAPVWLVVQLYRDGWVRVFPAGPGASRDARTIQVPASIVREQTDLALALGAALRFEDESELDEAPPRSSEDR